MSTAEELEKLKRMRDDRTITQEQYERAVIELEETHEPLPLETADGTADRRRRWSDEDDDELTSRERERKSREWAMWLHLSLLIGHVALIAGIVAPVLMWHSKKDEWPRIDRHGRNALNWLISYYIYLAISGVLCFVLVGFVLLPVVLALGIVFPIVAAVRANEGREWHYPLAIPFLS